MWWIRKLFQFFILFILQLCRQKFLECQTPEFSHKLFSLTYCFWLRQELKKCKCPFVRLFVCSLKTCLELSILYLQFFIFLAQVSLWSVSCLSQFSWVFWRSHFKTEPKILCIVCSGEKPSYKFNNTGPVLGVVGGSYSSVSLQVEKLMTRNIQGKTNILIFRLQTYFACSGSHKFPPRAQLRLVVFSC